MALLALLALVAGEVACRAASTGAGGEAAAHAGH
jgi:hypothetical protein